MNMLVAVHSVSTDADTARRVDASYPRDPHDRVPDPPCLPAAAVAHHPRVRPCAIARRRGAAGDERDVRAAAQTR